ncbi:MAG: hypothetical protein ABUL63_02465 [Acidobacteriota bacterium]
MMREYHPDPRVLERFVRAVASPPEAQLVVRHLLTRCPRCRAIVQELAEPGWAARQEPLKESRKASPEE